MNSIRQTEAFDRQKHSAFDRVHPSRSDLVLRLRLRYLEKRLLAVHLICAHVDEPFDILRRRHGIDGTVLTAQERGAKRRMIGEQNIVSVIRGIAGQIRAYKAPASTAGGGSIDEQ